MQSGLGAKVLEGSQIRIDAWGESCPKAVASSRQQTHPVSDQLIVILSQEDNRHLAKRVR